PRLGRQLGRIALRGRALDRLLGADADALHDLLLGGPEAVDLLLGRRRHALDALLGDGAGPRGERDGEAADEQHPAHDGSEDSPNPSGTRALCRGLPGLRTRARSRQRGTARMSTQRPAELEEVIGEVAASYGAGGRVESRSRPQLPNKRQRLEARNHPKAGTEPGD